MIEAGEKAPEFALPDQDGEDVSRADYAGRTAVLYFYPTARSMFMIDGDGSVVHVIPKASPKTHDDDVLEALAA